MLTLSSGSRLIRGSGGGRSANAGNRRAKDLEGEDLLKEFHWCAASALRLGEFAGMLAPAMASRDHYEWPARPKIPSRADVSRVSADDGPMTPSPRRCSQGRSAVAHAARAGPMLHPSRGGRGRPHEGHAQAFRELQRSHLAARGGNKTLVPSTDTCTTSNNATCRRSAAPRCVASGSGGAVALVAAHGRSSSDLADAAHHGVDGRCLQNSDGFHEQRRERA
jgi:hypothetical protein